MAEGSMAVENPEITQYPPVKVTYDGNINPTSPPLKIDGGGY